MLQYLKKFRHRTPKPQTSADDLTQLIKDVPRYPPYIKGLPVVGTDVLLATQAELVGRIKGVLGYPQARFDSLVAPVLQRYAEFVHLLPASESHHHRGAGGLLRHGLEVAFWAAQLSEAQIFPYQGVPREKAEHEMRWRFAAFIAGLCHDLGKPVSDMEISDEHGTTAWDPWEHSLLGWTQANNMDRFFMRWRNSRSHKEHEEYSVFFFEKIAGDAVLSYLRADKALIMAVRKAISGTSGQNEVLCRLTMRADQESVGRDMQNNRLETNESSYGVPIHRYMFDAMRTLINERTWTVNEPGAKVWVFNDGAYIVWKAAVADIIKKIQEMSVPGFPRNADTLADILIERGYAVQNEVINDDGEVRKFRYWKIAPETNSDAKAGTPDIKFDLLALRLDDPERIFTGDLPPVIRGSILKQDAMHAAPASMVTAVQAAPAGQGASTPIANGLQDQQATQSEPSAPAQEPEKQEDQFLPPDLRGVIERLKKAAPPVPPLESADTNEQDTQTSSPQGEDVPVDLVANEKVTEAQTGQDDVLQPGKAKAHAQPVQRVQALDSPIAGMSQQDNQQPNTEADDSAALSDTNIAKPEVNDADVANEQLKAMLDEAKEAGQIIDQLVQPIVHGEQWLGQMLMKVGAELVILYPDGLKAMGKPMEIVGQLFEAGLIVPDPVMQDRKVREINDMKAVVLTRKLGLAIMKVLDQARDEDDPMAPKPRPKPKAPKTSKRQTKQAPAQNEPASDGSTPPSWFDDMHNESQPAQAPAAPAQTAPITTPKQKEKSKPKVESSPNPAKPKDNAIKPEAYGAQPSTQRSKERKAPALDLSAKVFAGDDNQVPEEAFTPRTITVADAIKELSQMMVAGEGRWLLFGAHQVEGYYVTDIGAFERMIAEYPDCLSRTELRLAVRYANGFLRAGKIHIKV